jgi:RsiW-degrading membrane proteinase PrsW (M82 family)
MEQPKESPQQPVWPVEAHPEVWTTPGFGWRVAVSILIAIGWLSFVILWLFFYAGKYDVFQNLAIVIVSVLVGVGLLGAMWAPWGMRMAKSAGVEHPWRSQRSILMTVISIISGIGWLSFIVAWLFFYAGDYSGYQNLAVLILSLLVVAIVNGGGWAVWGMWRHRY